MDIGSSSKMIVEKTAKKVSIVGHDVNEMAKNVTLQGINDYAKETVRHMPRATLHMKGDLSIEKGAPGGIYKSMLKERRRKRNTLFMLTLFFVYSLTTVGYFGAMRTGSAVRSQGVNMGLNLAVSTGFTCILWGIWILTCIWFETLPSLRLYGRMFKMNKYVLKVPGIVTNMTVGCDRGIHVGVRDCCCLRSIQKRGTGGTLRCSL